MDSNSTKRRNPFKHLKAGLHAAMGLMYIIVGAMAIYYQWFIFDLKLFVAWGLGIVVILYGIFRAFRAYTIYKEE